MTTSTIIPYRAGKQWRPAEGPTMCARCHVGLLHRSSDRVEETVDLQTNAELTIHIWEHDVDSEGRALCGSCAESDEQDEAWRQIVAWKWRSEKRSHVLSNSGLELFDDYRSVVTFVAKDRKLDVGLVLAFVGRDPLRPGASSRPVKMEPSDLSKGSRDYFAALEGALPGPEAGRILLAGSPDPNWDPNATDDECPETERNTEHE